MLSWYVEFMKDLALLMIVVGAAIIMYLCVRGGILLQQTLQNRALEKAKWRVVTQSIPGNTIEVLLERRGQEPIHVGQVNVQAPDMSTQLEQLTNNGKLQAEQLNQIN